jgi:hypothetical protein
MNSRSSFWILEISGADFTDDRVSGAMQEMARVPRQPPLIVPSEEVGLFHIVRQPDLPTQNGVEPSGRGPWRTDYYEIRHAHDVVFNDLTASP